MQFKFLFMGKNTAGIIFIFLLIVGVAASLMRFPVSSDPADIIKGEWMKKFENSFGEASVFTAPSKNLWAEIERGKREVVFGTRGQLYTVEEFLTSRQDDEIYKRNIDHITKIHQRLTKENTRLLIAVIPSKARVTKAESLPQAKKEISSRFKQEMDKKNIEVVLLSNIEFLKTDTHWSPEGARNAAEQISMGIRKGTEDFSNVKSGVKLIKGDLQKFVSEDLPEEKIDRYELEGGTPGELFADVNIPVVLVGTSYSAKREFNFENFLKEYLKRDVLNAADEGRGPFVVMENYLQDKSYSPEIVIWEIPERYLTMHLE